MHFEIMKNKRFFALVKVEEEVKDYLQVLGLLNQSPRLVAGESSLSTIPTRSMIQDVFFYWSSPQKF